MNQTDRIPEELAARLERLSRETRRSKSSFIVEALARHLDEDLEIVLSRFRDPAAGWVEHADARNDLGLD